MRRRRFFPRFLAARSGAVTPIGRTSAQCTGAAVVALLVAACGARTGFDGADTVYEGSDAAVYEGNDAAVPVRDAGHTQPQSVLLFGGLGPTPDGGDGAENDTWIWTAPGGWTEQHPSQSPSARFGAMAASLGGDVVLFGGDGSVAETWEWNGTTWAQEQPGWSPPPLTSSVLAPMGQGLVLFGGYDYGTLYHDAWRWDGASWTHDSPGATPPAREAPAGAILDGSLVVFGGEGVDLLPLGDTWVYDGTSWTQMQPAHSPSPRRGAVAAAFEGKVVLFGGDTIPEPYGDWVSVDETWIWDGTDWTQEHPAQSPDARSFAGMAAAGGQVVLFGGGNFGGTFAQPVGTWTWDGTRWTERSGPGPGPRNYPAMAAR